MGSHIGGALAAMLALTEPNSVHVLALVEPMLDWVGLDEVADQPRAIESSKFKTSAQKREQRQAQGQALKGRSSTRFAVDNQFVLPAAEELIKLRSKSFKTPSAYFDPFASPMLFLRAPGRDTPLATTVGDQLNDETVPDERDSGYRREYAPDAFGPHDDDWQSSSSSRGHEANTAFESEPTIPPRRRKVLRRWPAVGNPEDVTLPHVGIFVASESDPATSAESTGSDIGIGHAAIMRAQGREMCELMRRACFIGRENGFAEERVQLQLCGQPEHLDEVRSMEKSALRWVSEMCMKD